MPIYEYRCADCGTQREHLQKLADAPIALCPSCGGTHYGKLLSAAGFQLKGSGWYATDFKGGAKPAPAKDAAPDVAPAAATPATDAAPATPCGGSCACH